jgi:hypothetical protein
VGLGAAAERGQILGSPGVSVAAKRLARTGSTGSSPKTVLISQLTEPIAPMPWSQIRREKYQCTTYDDGNEREKRAVTL